MPVKPSQSAARVLAALEKIALNQPIGVSELARLLDANMGSAQRALVTLANEGWIRPAQGRPTRWELTAHIHTIAQHAYGNHDLRQRARVTLEELRKETGESVLLIVPDSGNFIVIEVLESHHYLRSSPPVGLMVPTKASATAWSMLPYMTPDQQIAYLGEAPDAASLQHYQETIARGYSISMGDVFAGSTNIAAPIIEFDGRPIGAVLVSAPNDRAGQDEYARLGALVSAAARKLSRGNTLASRAVVEAADAA